MKAQTLVPLAAAAAAQLLVVGNIAAAFAFQQKPPVETLVTVPVVAEIEQVECVRQDPVPYEPVTYQVPLDAELQSYTEKMCDLYDVPLELAYMAAEFRDLRETGVEDALVVATLEEAMRHQAKHPWCYAKRLLDQAAAQHVTTFAEWEKTHIKNKGNRVDRETPSGNNILGLTDSLGRIKRRPFKKQDVPQGKGGDFNGE